MGLGSAMMDLKRGEGGSCRVWGFSEDGDGSESGWGNRVWGLSEDGDGSEGGEIGSGVSVRMEMDLGVGKLGLGSR